MIRIEAVPLLAVKLLVQLRALAAVKSKSAPALYRAASRRRDAASDRSQSTLRRRPQASAPVI
jgi:hypothetical protein